VTGTDQREFEQLWARHHRRVHAYALRRALHALCWPTTPVVSAGATP
jgi:hypothetical protein